MTRENDQALHRMTLDEQITAERRAARDAAKKLHPDAGGDPQLFRQLTEARDLLVARSR